MRLSIFVLFLISIGVSIVPALAANPEYRCEPGTVANDAVAVAYANVDVAAFSDPDNDICTFAIGGASKGGPSSRESVSPIAQVFDQARSGNLESLVLRLIVARSNLSQIDSALVGAITAIFSQNLSAIDACITALEKFDSGPPTPLESSKSDALVYLRTENDMVSVECSVLKPGKTPVLISPFPTLRLYSRSKGTTDTLFVPNEALP